MAEHNPFDGPVPGQSLTVAPGSHPFEKAPQFADPNDALEFVWDQITQPRSASKILAALKAGVTAEYLARTIIFLGFQNGQWTPDAALLMGRPVLYMIAKIAEVKGMTDIKLFNEDKSQDAIMREFAKTIDAKKKEPETKSAIAPVEEELAKEESNTIQIGIA